MTDLLEQSALAVNMANGFRSVVHDPEAASVWEEEAAYRLTEHNAAAHPDDPAYDWVRTTDDITESVEQDTDDLPDDPDAAWDEGGEG
ncbi:MAG: hypothetical protein KF809_17430 [Chloroflexi bacterium]|nr:hypothetical protein [Chloroflexota bacterium]